MYKIIIWLRNSNGQNWNVTKREKYLEDIRLDEKSSREPCYGMTTRCIGASRASVSRHFRSAAAVLRAMSADTFPMS